MVDMDAVQSAHVGVAHTRWATHGEPSDRNAHPQSSKEGHFVVVHNGIMTNYSDMKKFLLAKGYEFTSDTDTEVIAQLMHYLYHSTTVELESKLSGQSSTTKGLTDKPLLSLPQLAMETMELIEGAYALVVVSPLFPQELVAFKRGSPLIVGVKSSDIMLEDGSTDTAAPVEFFVSSDSSSIIEHTSKVTFLEDDDIVHVARGTVVFANRNRSKSFKQLKSEIRHIHELEVALGCISKGEYPHYMLKEIFEQPDSITNSMRGRLAYDTLNVKLGGFSAANIDLFKRASRIIFIACGTSFHACVAVRPLFEELGSVPVMLENASDFLDRSPLIARSDICIFVSQSGETADTLRALEYCNERGAVLVGITNTVGSSISRLTNFGAHLNCGIEVGVASTKAYTSQIVTMQLVSILLSADSVSSLPRRRAITHGLSRLSSDAAECLRLVHEPIKELAQKLLGTKSILVLGRGYHIATALEAALKISELAYIHSQGINAGELKHGPLALVDEHLPVIILCTKDSIIERVRSAIMQVKARKGRPIVIAANNPGDPDAQIESTADTVIYVPQTVDCLQTVINVIPLQLLAYYLAVGKGNNVDCPRNLAKSVTVQ